MDVVEQPATEHRGSERFVFGLLWNWMGVATGLFTGLLLSPYLIRKLGPEAYGFGRSRSRLSNTVRFSILDSAQPS